jgi:charged multivesicular body protein 2B
MQLEREKKRLEIEIKKAAKEGNKSYFGIIMPKLIIICMAGNKQACVILAKQLIQLRKQETRTVAASSRITGIKTHTQVMASNIKLGEAMKTTTQVILVFILNLFKIKRKIIDQIKTMVTMNKMQDPMKTAKIMKDFEVQNMKMGMTDEMINETLDGVLEGSDDEAESDQIVNKVLDEIGIEISGKLINAPTPARGIASSAADDDVSDADIQNMLAKLKA